jgi:tRNA (guanine6-N2)-methyltransferase
VSTGIDLDRAVTDTVHLQSLPGVVERLLQQCHDVGAPAMTDIRRMGDAVVLDLDGPLRPVAEMRLYSAFSIVLGDYAENERSGYAPALDALRRSASDGVLSGLTEAALRFRVDPLPDRWALRDRVTEAFGWTNDPGDWHVNFGRADRLLLGQIGPLYHSRRFPALRRIPASTNPVVAALLVQLLKARPQDVVYDPFCGAGTLLVEAAALDLDLVLLGSDRSWPALHEAAANRPVGFPSGLLFHADATRLPIADDSVDRVVANLPFGKRVGSHSVNVKLYPAFVAELNRVLRSDGRAVLLTDDKNLFRQSVEATPGTRILREVQVATGSLELFPTAFVLERTRTARRSAARTGQRGSSRRGSSRRGSSK